MNNAVILMFVLFLVMLFLKVPIAYSLGISAMVYLFSADIPLDIVAQKMFYGMNSFTMVCIPSFMLAGNLMNRGGITNKIVEFSNVFVGHIRGSLAYINIIASTVFAGISGTALADVASLGSMLIPAMKEQGYDDDFSVAITASTSIIGPIIPPSVPMIIAGTMTGLSISKLFVGGVIPGIILGIGFFIPTSIICKKRNYPVTERYTKERKKAVIKDAVWALMMPVIMIGGILSGLFTATEASIVTVIYGLIVGIYVYNEITYKDIPHIFKDTIIQAGSVIILVAMANLFAYVLTVERIPQQIASGILSLTTNYVVVILLINLILLFVGMFMESIAAIIIMFPVLLPVGLAVGMNPIHFAIMAILNLMIGLVTPPVGLCMTTAAQIGKVPVGKAIRANLPYYVVLFTTLLLVSFMPSITTFLPQFFS